jgi:hypothetical protein
MILALWSAQPNGRDRRPGDGACVTLLGDEFDVELRPGARSLCARCIRCAAQAGQKGIKRRFSSTGDSNIKIDTSSHYDQCDEY